MSTSFGLSRRQRRIQLLGDIVFDRHEVRNHDVDDGRWRLAKLAKVSPCERSALATLLVTPRAHVIRRRPRFRMKYLNEDQRQ